MKEIKFSISAVKVADDILDNTKTLASVSLEVAGTTDELKQLLVATMMHSSVVREIVLLAASQTLNDNINTNKK